MGRGRLPEYKLLQSADPQPGGAQIIVNNAGKDVSHLFKGIHPERTLELNLDESQRVGRLDDEGE
jgi:L-lactate dehydrogenase (cytochrome)